MATRTLSPCIGICTLDPATSLCRGCRRSVQEIGRWLSMSEDERARVVAELPGRVVPEPVRA